MRPLHFAPAVLALGLSLACDPAPPPEDAGPDAGGDIDAGPLPDAGPPRDTGPPVDTGPQPDAGPRDAGPPPTSLGFETLTLSGGAGAFTDIAAVPGTTDEVMITRHEGTVVHYRIAGGAATLLGEFTVPSVVQMVDCGLLALSFDPDYVDNGFLFAGHCSGEGDFDTRITRLRFEGDYSAVAATAVVILDVSSSALAAFNHNVSNILFDDDNNLLVGVGDKGRGPNAQDLNVLPGSLLRITPSREIGVGGYTVPSNNPNLGGQPEIFAYGLRYPWRLSRDPMGRIWAGDVGEGASEEVNILTAGGDYGWNLCEGPCSPPMSGVTDPVTSWDRNAGHEYILDDPDADATGRRVVWIAPSYSGEQDRYGGLLTGRTLFGDTCIGFVRSGAANAARDFESVPVGHLSHAVAFTELDGWLYAVTFGSCDSTQPFDAPTLVRTVPVFD